MTHTRTPARALCTALLLTVGLGLAGCSSGGSGEASSDAGSVATGTAQQSRGAGASSADSGAEAASSADVARSDTAQVAPGVAEPAIISTASLTVRSDDVATARFDLEKVVDSHSGTIASEKTTATDQGRAQRSRLELRIPSEEFDAALADLAELGQLTDSTRKAQDVTGEVIDTRARVRAQEQSLERVEVLFSRAENIRDIVAIEAQLSRRQADLDSLKGQLAYLEDQTTLSTVTVYLEQTPRAAPDDDDSDANAFVAGLTGGWHALGGLASALAAIAGALLPFALVVLLLGVPGVVGVRRWLARRPSRQVTETG